MSAAAARRRKQLAARKKESDVVADQLQEILASCADDKEMDEAVAYEALQLAQSQVRKKVAAGDFTSSLDLCYTTSLKLLQKNRVSVASQLLQLLAEVLRETHTAESTEWLERLQTLHDTRATAMEAVSSNMLQKEVERLERVQRDWLLRILAWSADIGTTKYGHNQIQKMLGTHCWKLAKLMETDVEHETMDDDEYMEEIADLQCDAVQHMALAEEPAVLVEWLAALPEPTEAERKVGHACLPAVRDGLLTRAVLLLAAVQNLRDANLLLRGFIQATNAPVAELQKSYTNKEDGLAPSHIMFNSMLLRILEKDARTGPLYSWLLRSFKRSELDKLHKPAAIASYTTKIGKVYFNIQPPPNMLSMMENMMAGMGGMGGMGAGGPGGINPAMMQAAMAQLQQGGMM